MKGTELKCTKFFQIYRCVMFPRKKYLKKITEDLIGKNSCLQNIEGVNEKTKLVFSKSAVGGTVHYYSDVLTRSKEMIHTHGDVTCLKWPRYAVRQISCVQLLSLSKIQIH